MMILNFFSLLCSWFATGYSPATHQVDRRCAEEKSVYFSRAFAQSSFDAARAELGLPPSPLPGNWSRMFNYVAPHCTVFPLPAHCGTFQSILKCGALSMANTFRLARRKQQVRSMFVSCTDIDKYRRYLCRGKPHFSFTFVREPLSHYISGYGEYMYREHIGRKLDRGQSVEKIRRQIPATELPAAYVQNHIAGPVWLYEHHANAKHMSLMSGLLSNRKRPRIDFVGHLSRAEDDWRIFLEAAGTNGTPAAHISFEKEYGIHPSSNDSIGIKAELRALLLANHTLRRGLCRLLERDYLCFQYNFEACMDGSALQSAC